MCEYTIKVLGSGWDLDEWPERVRCQHKKSNDDMRWYVPERTCKIRQAYFDSDDELHELMEVIACSPEDTVACVCEECGHDWRYGRSIRPSYCPNCGARVVGD